MHTFQKTAVALSSVALLLALGACGKHDEANTAATDTSTSTASSQSIPSDTSSTASTAPSTTDSTMASSTPGTSDSSTMASSSDTSTSGTMASSSDAGSNTSVMGAAGEKMDDAGIVTKIKTSLAADSDLSALKIDVDAKDGVVTLNGTAPSKSAKDKATDIAKNTKDVKDVKNNLKVAKG